MIRANCIIVTIVSVVELFIVFRSRTAAPLSLSHAVRHTEYKNVKHSLHHITVKGDFADSWLASVVEY